MTSVSMKQSLLDADSKDVTNPASVSMFDQKKDVIHKRHPAARQRIDTTERFQMDHGELQKLKEENATDVKRRNEFIKANSARVDKQAYDLGNIDESDSSLATRNIDHLYRISMSNMHPSRNRLPINLSWRNITYTVTVKPTPSSSETTPRLCADKQQKTILNNINGDVQSGKLVAIMGPSGSGKTTLLNVISRRLVKKKNASLQGEIIINGVHRYELGKTFTNLTAFVQQDDVLFNQQTVYETLMTAAQFSPLTTSSEHAELVESVLRELDLVHIRNTKIGDAQVRGVSGGERKRANIATQMIRNPSVLFLDEPTSGLDSYQALKVMETLKRLCLHGCTVITSIHQPRSSIFGLFDDIVLLSNGSVVYHGPSGDDALRYFAAKGYVCPAYFNPADFFLDLVSIDTRTEKEERASQARIEFLVQEYQNDFEKKTLKNYTFNEYTEEDVQNTQEWKQAQSGKISKVSNFKQLQTLSVRTFRQMLRDRRSFFIRILMNIIFAVFISGVYSQTRGSKSPESIMDREGVLFFMCILQTMGPIINTVQAFCLEKSIVMRERQTRTYSLGMYYITTFVSTIPIQIIFPVIFGCILYWIVGLNILFERFLWFLIITVLTNFSAIGLGFLCGCGAPSVEAATTIAQTAVALMILFSGFFIHVESLPVWLQWLTYISVIRWAFMAFMINEFAGETGFECSDKLNGCIQTGDEVLARFSFDSYTKQQSVMAIAILLASFHVLAFIILKLTAVRYQDVDKRQHRSNNSFELMQVQRNT